MDLYSALYTYLKTDQQTTIQTSQFASQYIPSDQIDIYTQYMLEQNFPANAIPKDLSQVNPSLKRRKLLFKSDIKLSAPSEVFNEQITYKTEIDTDKSSQTIITIKDNLIEQS